MKLLMNKEIYIKKSMVPFNSTANVKIKLKIILKVKLDFDNGLYPQKRLCMVHPFLINQVLNKLHT